MRNQKTPNKKGEDLLAAIRKGLPLYDDATIGIMIIFAGLSHDQREETLKILWNEFMKNNQTFPVWLQKESRRRIEG